MKQHNKGSCESTKHLMRFFNIHDVQCFVGGKSRSTIYRWIANGSFPSPVKTGGNSSAWSEESLLAWQKKILSQNITNDVRHSDNG